MMQILDDPSGNSFIENRLAPDVDPFLSMDRYSRTNEQEVQLGIIKDSNDMKVCHIKAVRLKGFVYKLL